METSWLIERLDNPALLQKGDEQRLRELIATYPYFSAPYLLLARSLHDQKHPAFEQLLPLISLQAFDRKRLFKLIHEETGGRGDLETRGLGEEETGGRGDLETRGLGDEENEMVRHAERSRSTTDETEAIENEDETPIDRRAGVRFSVDFAEVEKSEEAESTLHEELQEIPFLLTMDHGPLTMEDESEVEVEVKVEENESPNHKSQIINHNSQFTNHKSPDRIDFMHWLEKLQPVKKVAGAENFLPISKAEEESTVEGQPSTEESIIVSDNSLQPSAYSLQPDPSSLIDKFIETNPSVSRVKERFYDPAVQARESERLDDNLMTETLARIFVKQEKYERAIDAYRKLQLKYPEKSDYFAALILEINSKIN